MEVVAHPGTLQQLTQRLQDHLRSVMATIPFQIQCVLKPDKLMVLTQHPADKVPDPQLVLSALELVLQSLPREWMISWFEPATVPELEAKLYLRVSGQHYPYAVHTLKLMPDMAADSGEQPVFVPIEPFAEAAKQVEVSVNRASEVETQVSEPPERSVESSQMVAWVPELELGEDLEQDAAEPEELGSAAEPRSPLLLWIIAGTIISVVSFLGGLLIMSRPCMFGQCEPFQAAQELSQKSTQAFQNAKSWQDLRNAQQPMLEANRLLDRIPQWSQQHREAEAMLQKHLAQASALNHVFTVEAKAEIAVQKSQTVPQAVSGWQSVRKLWREAIAQLATVPAASPLHPFAKGQIAKYQENLATIDQYLAQELQAKKTLKAAQDAAKISELRQSMAQSPESWQQVQVSWQTAVNALKQVSNRTTSYAEARELLESYEAKLTKAREQVTQEQLANKAYAQALGLSRSARTSQGQLQWSRAVYLWREALANAKRVPMGTQRYGEAQTLVADCANALQNAEVQLQSVVALQKTRSDLDQLCAGSPKICTYLLTNDLIRIQYTPAYEQALRTAFASGQSGNSGTLGGAVNHVESLQVALQALANNAGMPIEVYSANGAELMGSFNPGG